MKYVLTGGPCTGKTSTINMLYSYGYQTVKEAASILVEEEFRKKTKPLWEIDAIAFQRKLILKQLEFESENTLNETTFVDRGVVDTITYCKIYNVKIPKDFYEIAEKNRYKKVFILDFLKKYKTNFVRRESQEQARKIQTTLFNTYKEFGYNPILVPNYSIEKRIDFILENIINIENILKKDLKISKEFVINK